MTKDDILNAEIEAEHRAAELSRIFGESDRLYIKTLDEPDEIIKVVEKFLENK